MSSQSSTEAAPSERRAIVGRATVVASGTLVSRILGLGREQVLAAMFTRLETDAFIIAFMIPNLLRQLLAEGAVQTAVLPVLAASRETRGDAETRELFRRLRALSLLALVLASALGVFAAPWLVQAFAGGFEQHPGQLERTTLLTRLVFPYIFFMGSASLGLAVLNTYQRYVVTAFAPALLNVSFIACGLWLPALFVAQGEERTLALAVGVWLGGILQLFAQWPSLRAIGMLQLPSFDLFHPGVRDVLRRLGPALLGIGVYYVDVLVARHLLSGLDVGATSYFTFALRLCDFPQGIFVMSLQAATLPSLSRLAARGDTAELSQTFSFGMRLCLLVAIPASVLMTVLAEPLVVLIFQRGHFDALAASETARALVAQGTGIWLVAAVRQLTNVYYALGDTRTPALISMLDFGVFVAAALALRGALGHVGISWAVTFASLAQMLLLWWGLGRADKRVHSGGVFGSALSTSLACVPAAAAGWAVAKALHVPGAGALQRALPGALGSLAFLVVFFAAGYLLRHPELRALMAAVRRRSRAA